MILMDLYHITYEDYGDKHIFIPSIPYTRLESEDSIIPRVCASTTIYQCLLSKSPYCRDKFQKEFSIDIFVYHALIPVMSIIQPSIIDVEDSWFTSEFWVINEYEWTKVGEYILHKGEKVTGKYLNNRYYFHKKNASPIKSSNFALDGKEDNFYFTDYGY